MLNEVTRALIIPFLFLFIFCGCKQRDPVKEIKLKGLTIQLRTLPDAAGDGSASYAARLIPDKALLKEKGGDIKSALMYRMDSCFYMRSGGKTVYAALVQPVANGLTGIFEYLVTFDKNEAGRPNSTLIYQDKYLNKARYSFKP